MVIEILLYHLLDETALLQVSDVGPTGPWTDLRLTSTLPVRDALVEWEALAEAAIPGVDFDFNYQEGNGVVNLYVDSGTAWIKCTETLQILLGQEEVTDGAADGSPGAGITSSVNGVRAERTTPLAEESSDFEEFRGGRAASYHYARAREVGVKLWLPDIEYWQPFYEYPLLQGLCAFRLETRSPSDYSESNTGGRLTLYPYDEKDVTELEGSEDFIVRTLKTTVGDAS